MLHGKLCSKCRVNPRRLRDYYCEACRKTYNKEAWAKQKKRLDAIRAELRAPEAIIARMKATRDRRLANRTRRA